MVNNSEGKAYRLPQLIFKYHIIWKLFIIGMNIYEGENVTFIKHCVSVFDIAHQLPFEILHKSTCSRFEDFRKTCTFFMNRKINGSALHISNGNQLTHPITGYNSFYLKGHDLVWIFISQLDTITGYLLSGNNEDIMMPK